MVIKSKKQIKIHLHKLSKLTKLRATKKHKKRLTGGVRVYTCDNTTIGKGGFGTVLACKSDDKLDTVCTGIESSVQCNATGVTPPISVSSMVAVKIAKTDKSIPELQNEIDIYKILGTSNTHIVKRIDDAHIKFNDGNIPDQYLVLEYCNGGDLSNFVKTTDTYNITDILGQIFDGMTYLFEKHILHLDLKPGNILVHTSDADTHTFKIADFGLAKHITGSDNSNIIRVDLTTMKAGTPIYKPTFKNIDRSTYFRDLYAFYCIMYYLYNKEHYNVIPAPKKMLTQYETKQIVNLTPNILPEISKSLTALQSTVFSQIKADFEKVKAQGTAFTKRGKPNLNISGIDPLNISGSESNNNEPSFDKINVDNDFYKSYYLELKGLLAKAQPITPLKQQKDKNISVNSTLAGNTAPVSEQ